jgi:hypothetical protein
VGNQGLWCVCNAIAGTCLVCRELCDKNKGRQCMRWTNQLPGDGSRLKESDGGACMD